VLALEIVEDLKAALAQFEAIEEELSPEGKRQRKSSSLGRLG
jgi:hypothetical protein